MPELLRALVSGDEEQAAEAVYELYGTIWHQGSVYPATIPAVPFLVRIAVSGAAGAQTPELLGLLADIASSSDPRGVEDRDAVRSAVGAHTETIAGLLEHPDAPTRAAALFVLVHASSPSRIRPLILQRWDAETEALPRAEVLRAMMRVDSETAAVLAGGVLSAGASGDLPGDAVLRLSAALAWIRAGRAMDERVRDAALNGEGELFDQFITALAEHQGTHSAIELLAEALDRSHEAPIEVAEQYVSTARFLIVNYRSAPALLAEPLARLLDRPDLARRVIAVLELIGPDAVGPATRDRVAALAAGADGDADDGVDDEALACLTRWNDPIVPSLLARALGDHPQIFNGVTEATPLPFDADLLTAIRHRLAEICDAAHEPSPDAGNLFAAVQNRNEPIHLAKILTSWGSSANPAEPELTRLLAVRPAVAAKALAAIGARSLEAMAMLRRVAATADDGDAIRARLAAAQAIRVLTQDTDPLVAAVHFGLTAESKNPDDRAAAAEAATELPEHTDLLAPLLLQVLDGIPVPTPSLPAHQARMKLGHALWLLTGRPESLIDVLRGTLDLAGEMFTAWTVVTAADLAAELGPAARELAPALEAALAEPVSCAAAAQALLAVDPEGPWASGARREELADRLLGTFEATNSPVPRSRAVDVLQILAGHGPLPATVAAKLRTYAEQDERFPIGVQDLEHLRADEELRSRIRALLSINPS
ncbi:hypothetical protein [Catenulispora acidiphila]|uniref:hypothetical protein n=1 Tax=Catenulispora acidiphila TaxID=304895 RepID=UPI00117C4169|nr:hypothetical protein [Catenulispora acidiphila]